MPDTFPVPRMGIFTRPDGPKMSPIAKAGAATTTSYQLAPLILVAQASTAQISAYPSRGVRASLHAV